MVCHKFIDLIGMKFGRLTVVKMVGKNKQKNVLWKCKCSCGKEIITTTSCLKGGYTKSCGCLRIEKVKNMATKHGCYNTKLYKIWQAMNERCYNINCKNFKNYGGRGISVCDEWKNDFMSFYKWSVQNGYLDSLERSKYTLDRVDNNGGYFPKNCRWITMKQQSKNRRTNIYYFLNGVKLCVSDISHIVGIKPNTYYDRKREGKTEIKDLFKGVNFKKYKIEEV